MPSRPFQKNLMEKYSSQYSGFFPTLPAAAEAFFRSEINIFKILAPILREVNLLERPLPKCG